MMLIRAIAVGFILFLLALVVVANRGDGNDWWPFLSSIPYGDKVGHVGLFGTLSLLCNLAFPNRHPSRLPSWITKTTLILLIIVSLEEISQAFLPTRSLDLFDWLADLLGIACGQMLALAILSKTGMTQTPPTLP
ncbi:MAG TPA: VanZ family protein [Luteolibacter sp.]|nr:VanZ family protein [Luteolibacter sp.]